MYTHLKLHITHIHTQKHLYHTHTYTTHMLTRHVYKYTHISHHMHIHITPLQHTQAHKNTHTKPGANLKCHSLCEIGSLWELRLWALDATPWHYAQLGFLILILVQESTQLYSLLFSLIRSDPGQALCKTGGIKRWGSRHSYCPCGFIVNSKRDSSNNLSLRLYKLRHGGLKREDP